MVSLWKTNIWRSAFGDETPEQEESTTNDAPDWSSDDADSPDPAEESSQQEAPPSSAVESTTEAPPSSDADTNSDAEYESTQTADVQEVVPEQEHVAVRTRAAIVQDQATQLLANIGAKIRERGISLRHLAVATGILLAVLAWMMMLPAKHADGCGCPEHGGGQGRELSMQEFMDMLGIEDEDQFAQMFGQAPQDSKVTMLGEQGEAPKEDLNEAELNLGEETAAECEQPKAESKSGASQDVFPDEDLPTRSVPETTEPVAAA